MVYCEEKKLAFSQIYSTTDGLRIGSRVYVLVAEWSTEIDYRFFEKLIIHKANPKIAGTYYASFKTGLGIDTGKLRKTDDWERSYFVVKISEMSGLVGNKEYRSDWNFFSGRTSVRLDYFDLPSTSTDLFPFFSDRHPVEAK